VRHIEAFGSGPSPITQTFRVLDVRVHVAGRRNQSSVPYVCHELGLIYAGIGAVMAAAVKQSVEVAPR
jgi:hypothetical protein